MTNIKASNTAAVLAAVENFNVTTGTPTVKKLVELTGLGETTVRKLVKELLNGGFISALNDTPTSYLVVRKQDETEKENMATDTTTKKAAPKKASAEAKPGRPRSADAQERDDKVLALITSGKATTKADIARELGVDPDLAYVSIWRLTKAGKITKVRDGSRAVGYTAA